MSEKANKAADTAHELEELRAQVARLTKALDEAKTAMKSDAEDILGEAADETAETFRQSARQSAEEFSERMQENIHDLQKHIQDNPVPAALGAFIIGLILGRIIVR